MRSIATCLVLVCIAGFARAVDEPILSGPQVGEKLLPFKVTGVFDPYAGKDIDFIDMAKEKPVVLIFVHDVNRMSISMVRVLTSYTKSRSKDVTTGVIWLSDDATDAENTIKRVKGALTEGVPIGVSPDGREGPGKYGLNRKVTLTILVGNKNKVTANFALVQPSLQADLPKILDAIVKEAGGTAPKLEEIEGAPKAKEVPKDAPKQDPNLRGLITPVIKLTATPEEVEKAAKELEAYLEKNPATKSEVGRICNTIINGGKLTDYGTPKAQEYLKKWAKEYGTPKKEEPKREKP